jgi:hypothetical protein
MPVKRISITMDRDLSQAVRNSAARGHTTVSAWLAKAAADRLRTDPLRTDLLGGALNAWEVEFGAFSSDELDQAGRVLGVNRSNRSSH